MDAKIKFHLVNWMLHKDKIIELKNDDSNITLFKGSNGQGKTAALNAILSLLTIKSFVPEPLTRGEASGVVEGSIPGPDGIYQINMHLSKSSTSFQMYNPQGIKISRISDMRKVFEYNSMTTEDFIKKSYTAEGRREQIMTLSSLLDIDDKIEFESIITNTDKRKGKLFLNRKNAKAAYENLEAQLKLNKVSKDELYIYDENSKIDEFLRQLRENERLITSVPSKDDEIKMLEKNFESDKGRIVNSIMRNETTIDDNETRIKALQQQINNLKIQNDNLKIENDKSNEELQVIKDAYIENLAASESREDTVEELAAIREEIESLEESRSKVLRIGGKIDIYKELSEKLAPAKESYLKAENDLQNARNRLTQIIKKLSVSGYELTIEDETIYIDGFPLNEHQVNGASLVIAVSAILAKVNKKSPILIVGKLSELDSKSLNKLEIIAKENDCIIIGDYVSDDVTDIVVEAYVPGGIENIPEDLKVNAQTQSPNSSKENTTSIDEI